MLEILFLAMPLMPLSIFFFFLQLQLTQNVFLVMRVLISEIAKSHTERDLANRGGWCNTGVRFSAKNCSTDTVL